MKYEMKTGFQVNVIQFPSIFKEDFTVGDK